MTDGELYLELKSRETNRGDGNVRCARCGFAVDFSRTCELLRDSRGHIRVTKCHACLTGIPSNLVEIVRRLVDVFGEEGARNEIERVLTVPR